MRIPAAAGLGLVVIAMVIAYFLTGAFPTSARWVTMAGILVTVSGIAVVATRLAAKRDDQRDS